MKEGRDQGVFPHYSFWALRWIVVLPFLAMFVLPFVMYGGRLRVRTIEGTVQSIETFSAGTVLVALGLVGIWLALAAGAAWAGSRFFPPKPVVAPPPLVVRFRIFLALALGGDLCFIAHSFLAFPRAFENLVHLLSLASGAALVLGVALLAAPQQLGGGRLWVVRALTVFQYLLITLLPLVLGKAYGAAGALILLSGALLVVRVRWAVTLLVSVIAVVAMALAMALKTPIRAVLFEGKPAERIALFQDMPVGASRPDRGVRARIGAGLDPQLRDDSRPDRGVHAPIGRLAENMAGSLRADKAGFSHYDQNSDFMILGKKWVGDGPYHVVQRAVHRLNHLGLLSLAVSRTPDLIPYWDAGLYEPLWVALVPRLIWPSKPEASFANDFGRRYGILQQDDFVTTVNLDPITQAWVTGGLAHVVISGAMAGLMFGFVYGWLNRGGEQWSRLYVCAAILSSVPSFESDVALAFGGLIQALAVAFAFTWLSHVWLARHAKMRPVAGSH